jgi:hypothetical protein
MPRQANYARVKARAKAIALNTDTTAKIAFVMMKPLFLDLDSESLRTLLIPKDYSCHFTGFYTLKEDASIRRCHLLFI